jgi:hypothetical protein
MKTRHRILLALGLLACIVAGANAQAPEGPPQPVVNSANELKDAALIDALRGGGYVLYMRHALQIPPTSEVCDKSSLTELGEAQARKAGAALRELKIPIGAVKSSQPCRSQDTARLLDLGKVEVTEDLNPIGGAKGVEMLAARKRRLAEAPAARTNTILVSHVQGGRKPEDRIQLEIAEIIVFRPDGKGDSLPVARIRLEAWDDLIRKHR